MIPSTYCLRACSRQVGNSPYVRTNPPYVPPFNRRGDIFMPPFLFPPGYRGERFKDPPFIPPCNSRGDFCGAEGARTPDLLNAIQTRSQLRHSPR